MNKQEKKYFNTASLMDEALLQLLEKKDYEFITVKELCQKAGVNRSTFYLHYESMNDLLEETVTMLNKRFYESFSKEYTIDAAINEDQILTKAKYLTPYLNFIKQNKRAYKLSHSKPILFKSETSFQKMYQTIFNPILDKQKVKEEEKKYIFEFYAKGVLAIVFKWVENDCQEDIKLIVDIIERCTSANENK